MSIGVLAHLFGKKPYRQLAAEVGEKGFKHVQLAIWKALNDYDFNKPGKLSPGLAKDIGDEFRKHGVSISVLACYLHFYHRDTSIRKENIACFKELIRHARYFDAPIVAAEVGKVTGDETDEDWAILRQSIEELADEAEKWGVILGIEPANEHLVGTSEALYRLMDEVPSSSIGVVLDPGNLMTADNFHNQNEVIREAFALLGDRIVACHAKDRIIDEQGDIQTVVPGRGDLNYSLYMELLEQYKPQVHIIMEAAKKHEMLEAKQYIEDNCKNALYH